MPAEALRRLLHANVLAPGAAGPPAAPFFLYYLWGQGGSATTTCCGLEVLGYVNSFFLLQTAFLSVTC